MDLGSGRSPHTPSFFGSAFTWQRRSLLRHVTRPIPSFYLTRATVCGTLKSRNAPAHYRRRVGGAMNTPGSFHGGAMADVRWLPDWVLQATECTLCRAAYHPVQPHQKYCSRRCKVKTRDALASVRRAATSRLSALLCEFCGHEFKQRSVVQKYCTRKCGEKAARSARPEADAVNKKKAKSIAHQRNANIIAEAKLAGCSRCPENHPGCLDFHHLDPSTKKKEISRMARDGSSEKHLLEEIAKCEILCSNCHRKEEWKKRIDKFPDSPSAQTSIPEAPMI